MRSTWLVAACALHAACFAPEPPRIVPGAGPTTRAGLSLDVRAPLPEYPRPLLVRETWMSLNGVFEFEELPASSDAPYGRHLKESIVVPFPVESHLSGIERHVEHGVYRRLFEVPKSWRGRRVILHFGAVDWQAQVLVNGRELGVHRGGYDAFDYDMTDVLAPEGEQELVVGFSDPADAGDQPRGKQVREPQGIWYTPSSGIWQSVWIEPVDATHVVDARVDPDLQHRRVRVLARIDAPITDVEVEAVASAGGVEVARSRARAGEPIVLAIPEPRAWSPEDPFLYDLTLLVFRQTREVDRATSYFGMRTVEVRADDRGIPRIFLNGARRYSVGLLDQGFWPDGLYTAATDEVLRADVELAKRLGFDLLRKHVKVEPQRWYAWCDRIGMLVWQDMPSGDNRTEESRRQFDLELTQMIEALRSHPSIVAWVVFNEGWGQHDTERVTSRAKSLDPSRLVSNASGWTDAGVGDLRDVHAYPGPGAPPAAPGERRATVLGEFGGLGLSIPGHTWRASGWSYADVRDRDELTDRYVDLSRQTHELARTGALCAAVYTQLSDVETECSGLVTYDREVVKVDEARVRAANLGRFPPITVLVADARADEAKWRHRFDAPADERWRETTFDDSTWAEGPGGFGTPGTPGAIVRTRWDTSDVWLRRSFELDAAPAGDVRLSLHHDEDAQVWIDGVAAAEVEGYTTGYTLVRLRPEARAALTRGRHVLAIHCRQTRGGQYVDAGLSIVGE